MAKAKGWFNRIEVRLVVVNFLCFVSIAWVECGNFANAAALKDWFDNKWAHPVYIATMLC